MPDHMHMVFNMLHDREGNDFSLGAVMKGIKGTSARSINELLHRSGSIWLDESFDHVIRAGERSRDKLEYVVNNPVRARLVPSASQYPWLWRSWVEGGGSGSDMATWK